jgi:hypothetical protein
MFALVPGKVSAQPAPPVTPAKKGASTHTLSPAESFGATYGTGNLARSPTATVPQNNVSPPAKRVLKFDDLKAAQGLRRLPPTDLSAFVTYTHNDELVQAMQRLSTNPAIDPTIPILLGWNHVALDMTSIDHTTIGRKVDFKGEQKPVFETTYGEQFGPPRTSRALAIVHLAMFEAANAIERKYASYVPPGAGKSIQDDIVASLSGSPMLTPKTVSEAAAINEAAHDTLVALYPRKAPLIEASTVQMSVLTAAQEGAADLPNTDTRLSLGREVGKAAAQAVLAARANDGSKPTSQPNLCNRQGGQPQDTVLPTSLCWETYWPKEVKAPTNTLEWTVDPISLNSLRLGETWGSVSPFVVGPNEFVTDEGLRLPAGIKPTPTAGSADFKDSLDKDTYGGTVPDPRGGATPIPAEYGVRLWGGYGPSPGTPLTYPPNQGPRYNTPSNRKDQTEEAQFWGYDATALLCAPPRLYNMLATSFVIDRMNAVPGPHGALDLARYLALVNLALADAGIESWKAKFKYNIARPITYIRTNDDPNHTDDPTWTPLGQVGSNGAPDNVTPPFPAYPSGHAVFGGAVFEMISKVLGVDKVTGSSFNFTSDEFNGHTFGPDGKLRSRKDAHFVSLASAEWENAESRVWLGIHWQQDADDGSLLGDEIADKIFNTVLRPITNLPVK